MRLSYLEQGEADVVGLCDVNLENSRRLMETVNRFRNITSRPLTEERLFTDHMEMFGKLSLEAVVVCTPHVFHYEHVMAALDAGLHVLVEKPMALSIREAEEMKRKADQKGLVLAVGYQRHFQPEYYYARETIKSGRIGSPHFIVAWLTQDLRRAIGPRTWYLNPELAGGGQVICSGTHLNDIVLWVADSEPMRVKALMDMEGSEVEMYASISAELSNGALASISILGDAPEVAVKEELRVWCSRGALFVIGGHVYVQQKGCGLTCVPRENLRTPSLNLDVNFVRAVLGEEECLVPASCGVKATKLEQMAYEDARPIPSNLNPAS
jgi:predicted dehydrogenase